MAVAYNFNYSSQLNSYRTQSVLGLTPGQLVLKAYDMLLSAIAQQDQEKACRVLIELIDSLDFQHGDIPVGLFRLYRYCMEQIKCGEYEVPRRILRDLRDTWAQALAQAASTN